MAKNQVISGTFGFDSRPGYKKPPQNQQVGEVFAQNKKVPPKVPPMCGIGERIRRMAGGIKYKDPKIVRAAKGWFVALYYEYPDQAGEYKRFEISAGINYIELFCFRRERRETGKRKTKPGLVYQRL